MEMIFYSHFRTDPFFNMAFDEWMFSRAVNQKDLIFLRLYSWSEGAITFGFNQIKEKALDFSQLGKTIAIRRITGGRGLYHEPSELTYSIALSLDASNKLGWGETVNSVSVEISTILVDFLSQIGIESHFMRKSSEINSHPDFFHKAPCFESYARNEIVANRSKIIASAQRRFQSTIFQHGAIKINGAASHPALPLNDLKANGYSYKAVREIDFHIYAEAFKNTFCRMIRRIEKNVQASDFSDDETIEKYLLNVMEKSLEQREIIIKQ